MPESKSETMRLVLEIETTGERSADEIRDSMVLSLLEDGCRAVRVLADIKSVADEPQMEDLSNLMVLYLMVLMPDFGTDPRQNAFASSLVAGLLSTVLTYPLVNVENGISVVDDVLAGIRESASNFARGYQDRAMLENFKPEGSAN